MTLCLKWKNILFLKLEIPIVLQLILAMKYTLYILPLLFIISCRSGNEKVYYDIDPNNRKVEALEIIQTTAYTYIKAKENRDTYWMAVSLMDANSGDTYYFTDAMEMNNFYSKDLDRTFDKIYFVSNISNRPIPVQSQASMEMPTSPHGDMKPVSTKKDINIEAHDGSITIADLYANKQAYADQIVSVVGEVTRFNPEIMQRNWVHIQDGTESDGNYDLTITTLDYVQVGDKVLVKGRLFMDKDFGSGYYYDVIVEDASVSKMVRQ